MHSLLPEMYLGRNSRTQNNQLMDLQREQLEGIKTPQNVYQGNALGKQKLRINTAIVKENMHAP